MAKKFIKTIYAEETIYARGKCPIKVDLYETDCFYIGITTQISNERYETKIKKDSGYFKYSSLKAYLETEFDQSLCDEFQRQSKEYKEKANYNLQQNTAKKQANDRMQLLTGALITEFEKFTGDWVEFNKKLHTKTEEIYQDFLKFMQEQNK